MKAIDRFLMKLDGRTIKENWPLLIANLQNYYRNAEKILITGIDTAQAQMVADYLTQSGMPVVCCGSLMQDAEAITELASCDSVLIVAECHRSCYTNIQQGCEKVGKDIPIGCVLING